LYFPKKEPLNLSIKVKVAWAVSVVIIVMLLAFYFPFKSLNHVSDTHNSPIEVARSSKTVTTIHPQYNNNPNMRKAIIEHTFINNPTDAISYEANINDKANSFIAVINDTNIKHISYTDHVGAQGALGIIDANGQVWMSPTHNVNEYPQFLYVNGGFRKGILTATDELGNIIFEESIILE